MKILVIVTTTLTTLLVLGAVGCAYAAIWSLGPAEDLAATAVLSGLLAIPLGGISAFLLTEEWE